MKKYFTMRATVAVLMVAIAVVAMCGLVSCVSTKAESETETDIDMPAITEVSPSITLNNGVEMPRFGLGTFAQSSPEVVKQSCLTAFAAGYRHIDTAHAYGCERAIGQAVRESGIPRSEIFVASKLWPNEYGEEITTEAIDKMLKRLQLDYIDLIFLHHPVGDYIGAWQDLEKAYQAGKVRALGLTNFDIDEKAFQAILDNAKIKPHVIQMELHPYAQRVEMRKKAARYNIVVEGWFPLGHGDAGLLGDETIKQIAKAHGKTSAQIILRWHLQEGFSVIPGSQNPSHIRENISIWDFELSEVEMQSMRSLNSECRFYNATIEDAQQFLQVSFDD